MKDDTDLLFELARRFGAGSPRPGERLRGRLLVGDMEAEVVVVVHPRPTDGLVEELRRVALTLAERQPWRLDGCACLTSKRQKLSRSRKPCSGPVSAVVVVRTAGGDRSFIFVCAAHRQSHGLSYPEAVITLPAARVKEIRAPYQRQKDQELARTERGNGADPR